MGKKAKSVKSMGEVLGNFLKSSGLSQKIQEQKLLTSWEKAVGEAVAERTQPIRVKNRILQVKVTNSVWMQQLQFMKGLIIQKLHEHMGNSFLQDLRFFIGEIDPIKKEEKKEENSRNAQSMSLSDMEKNRIEKELAGMRDPDMREILSRVYAKGMAAQKSRLSK